MLPSGRWNDIPCGHEKAVLCEAPCAAEEDADGDGSLRCGGDCDDLDPNINPEAEEVCRDGIDQDCSGVADDGDCISCEAVSRRGRQYALCTTAATWAEARVECRERGADLAIIDDVGEGDWNNIQAAQRFGAAYWVGLHDPDRDNVFEWVDGSAGDHSNWGSGEPNDPGEGCVEVYLDSARWNDARCGRAAPFVCEFDQ